MDFSFEEHINNQGGLMDGLLDPYAPVNNEPINTDFTHTNTPAGPFDFSGKLGHPDGGPASYTTIHIERTGLTFAADEYSHYTLRDVYDHDWIVFSGIGIETTRLQVRDIPGKLMLRAGIDTLPEVVITVPAPVETVVPVQTVVPEPVLPAVPVDNSRRNLLIGFGFLGLLTFGTIYYAGNSPAGPRKVDL